MKPWVVGLAGLLLATGVWAAESGAPHAKAEASMRVTGTIAVASDGSVDTVALDHPEALPAVVSDLVRKAAAAWRFAPVTVDGKPAKVVARMGLRVVAKPIADDRYQLRVASQWFSDAAGKADDAVRYTATYRHRTVPRYPPLAVQEHAAGTVYVVLKVGRDGTVADAAAEQVDLRTLGSERQMAAWRQAFAGAAVHALREDTFNPPIAGPRAAQPYWVVRIPVAFNLRGANASPAARRAGYGQWRQYLPGPRTEPAWARPPNGEASAADAVPDGAPLLSDSRLHLLASGAAG